MGQEVIQKTTFPSRDFHIEGDQLIFIQKMHLQQSPNQEGDGILLGGYGLELYKDKNLLITTANELVQDKSFVRFINLENLSEERVYYCTGRIVDFVVFPELKWFALSLINNKILVVSYDNEQGFRKMMDIKTKALVRKIIPHENGFYFIADTGELINYNFNNYKEDVILKLENRPTDFYVVKNEVIVFTIDGGIIKYNMTSGAQNEVRLSEDFVISSTLKKNKIICGSWRGNIYIIDLKKFTIEQELNIHKNSVIRLKSFNDDYLYSSSLDNTIKKWSIKL